MLMQGRAVKVVEGKGIFVFVPTTDTQQEIIKTRCFPDVVVEFDDGRSITTAQRRKTYVLLNAIADYMGYTPMEVIKEMTKLMFVGTGFTLREGTFSLSNCDRTTARMYITYLIDFCLVMDIPCGEPFWKLCEDIPRYVYACLVNKKCAVCGKKAELHHVDAVGAGRNRKEIIHVGMKCLPLCRTHHSMIHRIGKDSFMKEFILEPVKITDEVAEAYRLRR